MAMSRVNILSIMVVASRCGRAGRARATETRRGESENRSSENDGAGQAGPVRTETGSCNGGCPSISKVTFLVFWLPRSAGALMVISSLRLSPGSSVVGVKPGTVVQPQSGRTLVTRRCDVAVLSSQTNPRATSLGATSPKSSSAGAMTMPDPQMVTAVAEALPANAPLLILSDQPIADLPAAPFNACRGNSNGLPAALNPAPEDLAFKKPGDGISAARYAELIGRMTVEALPADHQLSWDDLK